MTPDTVHLIAQQIRHRRAELTCQETWLQTQQPSPTTAEAYRTVNFWRAVYKFAEDRLVSRSTD